VPIEQLMSSDSDALKLVSRMTLFRHLGERATSADSQPRFPATAEHADAILAGAAAQVYEACTYTEEYLRRRRS
jgi:hypothetical protein